MSAAEALHAELELDTEAGLLVDTLSPAECRRLSGLLEQARTDENAEVDAAVDAMVAGVPSVLRGRARGVLQRGDR